MSAFAATPQRHVAVFLFADFGHISPTLGLTRELIRRGHRVTYFVDHQYSEVVERTGARVVGYKSRRGAFVKVPQAGAARLAAEGYELLVESMQTVYPLALSTLAADPPDVVLYDFESFPAARMTAHTLGCATTVQLGISHASNEEFSLRVLLFDPDDPSLREGGAALMRFARDNGIPPEGLGRFLREWDERNLAFLPREFQIKGTTFDERFAFVGPTVAEPEGDVPWSPPADGRRLALVSLGTESNQQRDFFRTCVDAFDGDDWHVVMTLGRDADLAALGDLPPHVEAHRWLPHPAVLPHADVLVCHGGMSCLMEALYFATPAIVVPQAFEHTLTARRVDELGLGRMIERDRLTADTLGAAVGDIVADPEIPEHMAWMRASVHGAGGAPRAAGLLEQWAGRPAPTPAA
ncbi:glycosyltransferase, MGT family [Streptomyces sp. SceaMP-e96]|uniref:macrolide family glycosyltransferase n=1 Tax=unclassified Streptomyces TaxID=2593676 RepID=UPI0008239706|nr:macrolide family glycosyltransferase [Streptomyces sp. SceaMP-e96]MYT17597.1 glycosyl transferase [Streptomyces sp. SID4951]SCK45550.1 glycosyltransferase, MGT family [Streptomyces sp. SceaMP-e96]